MVSVLFGTRACLLNPRWEGTGVLVFRGLFILELRFLISVGWAPLGPAF